MKQQDQKRIPHRRLNPLTREWVLVSPQRTDRPWLGKVEGGEGERRPPYDPKCYLCPGNSRAGGSLPLELHRALGAPAAEATVSDLEFAHAVLVLDCEPVDDMPIVDLRMRFSLDRVEYTTVTVIIVVSVQSAAGRRDFGVVVDGVSDVVDVNNAAVKPAPELGSSGATDYIRGLVPVSERMVVLLDIDRLIGAQITEPLADAAAISEAARAA